MRHWVIGLSVAAVGVILAKVVPTWVSDTLPKLACYVVGIGLAFAGLAIVMAGMRRSASR